MQKISYSENNAIRAEKETVGELSSDKTKWKLEEGHRG